MWETRVQAWFIFVKKYTVTGFAVTLVDTYSETDSVKFNGAGVYNVRKIKVSGKSLRSFWRREKAKLLRRLSFRMGSFAKDGLQPLVNRISIKTLEKSWPSYILTYSSKFGSWLWIKEKVYIYSHFMLCQDNGDQHIQKMFILWLLHFATLFLWWIHQFVRHLYYLILTKPTIRTVARISQQGGQKLHGWAYFLNTTLNVCTNRGAKHEMGGTEFKFKCKLNRDAGHHCPPRWRRHHPQFSNVCIQVRNICFTGTWHLVLLDIIFVVMQVEFGTFFQIHRYVFWFPLNLKYIWDCLYASRTLGMELVWH